MSLPTVTIDARDDGTATAAIGTNDHQLRAGSLTLKDVVGPTGHTVTGGTRTDCAG